MTPEEATQKLFEAARSGNARNVRKALDAGAEVKAKDSDQMTPLHLAAESGHTEVAGLLIEKGADLNAKDVYHRTPLQWAVLYDHTAVAQMLTEAETAKTKGSVGKHTDRVAEERQTGAGDKDVGR